MPRTFQSVFVDHPSITIGVGWERSRYLQLGRATWHFRRDRLAIHIVYRNLSQQRDYPLGIVSAARTDGELLELFAAQHESHTPSDWVIIGKRVFVLAIDRGTA